MPIPVSLRAVFPLLIGLAVGAVGATLFLQSLPGGEGSPEERANKLEAELKHANNRIASLEAAGQQDRTPQTVLGRMAGVQGRRQIAEGTRRIADDIRAGRPVRPEDIFKATQPLLRDLAPLFDRMRRKELQKMSESLAGEYARKYNLTPEKQAALKAWFEQKSVTDAKNWNDLIGKEGTTFEDLARASHNVRPDEGLDSFMPGILPADQLATFQAERLGQRAERVQQEADRSVERIDQIAGLDEAQRDQVYGIMARGSRDYDPAMVIQGTQGPIQSAPVADPQVAALSVLRPDQRARYDAEVQRRRNEASKNMEAMGLTLPANWNAFDGGNAP